MIKYEIKKPKAVPNENNRSFWKAVIFLCTSLAEKVDKNGLKNPLIDLPIKRPSEKYAKLVKSKYFSINILSIFSRNMGKIPKKDNR